MSHNWGFQKVWLIDFEFSAPPGEPPKVVCLVAWEILSNQKIRVWSEELYGMPSPPYAIDQSSLVVAYYASAEMGCHLSLGWHLPHNVLDLFTEFRNISNGLKTPCGNGLLGALAWHGLSSIEASEKASMRVLAMRGGPWTEREKTNLLDYCESDVSALDRLLKKMSPHIDIDRAILRGRYMKAAACVEHNGVPIDMEILKNLQKNWGRLQDRLISEIDSYFGVYDGRTFKEARFSNWLISNNIAWPRLPSGKLDLKDDTFKEMSRIHPQLLPLRELRLSLSQMRLSSLAIGTDGRNRCLLSAFRSRTGRNQPSNSSFIFGPSVWLRGLIKPTPGYGLAYIDWSQQEFGIAAALSKDPNMKEAYLSRDPYLAFAKQAGAVPLDATKQSHKAEREQFKACVLAVQYGMGPEALALRMGQPVIKAKELLRLHRETYPVFWKWSDGCVDYGMLHEKLWTVFGWTIHVSEDPNPRFLRNFLMQGNGSEMLRLACCLLTEAGIRVCAPVHDAVLIEAPLKYFDTTIIQAKQLMSDASTIVLGGFRLESDVKEYRYPDRYMDDRGQKMWETVQDLLTRCGPPPTIQPVHVCDVTCSPMSSCPILLSLSLEVLNE